VESGAVATRINSAPDADECGAMLAAMFGQASVSPIPQAIYRETEAIRSLSKK
jgi:hypothetical protein